jgi:hypothetical protein
LFIGARRIAPKYTRQAHLNRFEKAVYDCMLPIAALLKRTTKPLRRAILLNRFWMLA